MSGRPEDLRLERELFVRAFMPDLQSDGALRLAAELQADEVPAGALLYRAGEPPEEFFFVLEGQVVMEAPGLPTYTFGDRSLVGMLDMTAGRPHRRSCRTTRPTRLLRGRAAAWLELLDDDTILGDAAIHGFSRRLHDLAAALGERLEPPPVLGGPRLLAPLALHEKALALRDTPLLAGARTQAIASLAQLAVEIELEPGAELFPEGGAEPALYVVASGVVAVRSAQGRLARSGAGQTIAPAAALSGHLGEYAVRAESRAIVLCIGVEAYFDQTDEHPDLTRAALTCLTTELERLMDLAPPTA